MHNRTQIVSELDASALRYIDFLSSPSIPLGRVFKERKNEAQNTSLSEKAEYFSRGVSDSFTLPGTQIIAERVKLGTGEILGHLDSTSMHLFLLSLQGEREKIIQALHDIYSFCSSAGKEGYLPFSGYKKEDVFEVYEMETRINSMALDQKRDITILSSYDPLQQIEYPGAEKNN